MERDHSSHNGKNNLRRIKEVFAVFLFFFPWRVRRWILVG